MKDLSPSQPKSDLLVVALKSGDVAIEQIDQMSALCRQNDMVTPNYASTPAKWNFLFRESPAGAAWVSMIVQQTSKSVHGFCGLAAFWARCGSASFRAATVSNIVIDPQIRNRRLPFRGKLGFSTLALMDSCFSSAIQEDLTLLVAHSRIPSTIWSLVGFETVNVRVVEMIYAPLSVMIRRYWKSFRNQRGKRKMFAAPHAVIVGLLSVWDRRQRVHNLLGRKASKGQVLLEEVTEFDGRLATLVDGFFLENADLMTCARDAESLNWRFKSPQFKRFLFSVNGRPTGACVIQDEEVESGDELPEIVDFILYESQFEYLPKILELLRKRFRQGFKWNFYVSPGYSERLFTQSFGSGYRAVAGAGSLWRESKKGMAELGVMDQFYFKTSQSASQRSFFVAKSEKGLEWYYTPLFFAPRYHAQKI